MRASKHDSKMKKQLGVVFNASADPKRFEVDGQKRGQIGLLKRFLIKLSIEILRFLIRFSRVFSKVFKVFHKVFNVFNKAFRFFNRAIRVFNRVFNGL